MYCISLHSNQTFGLQPYTMMCAFYNIALLKMGRYYNTTMCHYWDVSVK